MTKQQEINDIAKETLYVLSNFNPTFTTKISKQVLEKLKQLAYRSNKIVKIDKEKSLKEQNILPETKDMIALLYYNYVATIEEKREIVQKWNQNEKIYQEKLRKKYNLDNLFKKDNNVKEKNTALIEYKENIIQRIFNKIKKLLSFRK